MARCLASSLLLATALVTTVSVASAGWVKLLDNAHYSGSAVPVNFSPLRTGLSFTKVKAVHRSGYVSCDRSFAVDGHPWQECAPNHRGNPQPGFELMLNDNVLLEQPSWNLLPPECTDPGTPGADIICDVSFELKAGDTLAPTWLEARRRHSIHDNAGTLYLDLYGFVDAGMDDALVQSSADEDSGAVLAASRAKSAVASAKQALQLAELCNTLCTKRHEEQSALIQSQVQAIISLQKLVSSLQEQLDEVKATVAGLATEEE